LLVVISRGLSIVINCMMNIVNEESINVLDDVLLSRRTTRNFLPDALSIEHVNAVIAAGYLAPYASMTGLSKDETRRFIVLRNGTENMSTARESIRLQIQRNAKKLGLASMFIPSLRKKGKTFSKRLNEMSKTGIPSMGVAPVYIVVAERKGFPPVEKQSIAHVMENMWLKATALGLGFQLISATGMMSKDKEFMSLLGLKIGDYELGGCLIGYPKSPAQKSEKPDISKVTTWK